MKLSILVPSYGRTSKLEDCIASIYSSGADESQFEVVVCDSTGDSAQDTLKQLLKAHANMKAVSWRSRLPAGSARNIAWSNSSGEYVMCIDSDDVLAGPDVLQRVLDGLDGKDFYACSFISRAAGKARTLKVASAEEAACIPVACWTKIVKRELWVNLPPYMPEDVWPHFMIVDRCRTFGCFEFPVIDYDDTPENKGAMSRTFDWLLDNPTNLLELSQTSKLKSLGLEESFVAGVVHNLADMWSARNAVHQPAVKKALMKRLSQEYASFMAGVYVH